MNTAIAADKKAVPGRNHMKAIMVMFDSLNRHFLEPYGCSWTHTPNFARLAQHAVTFDHCYVGSMPCMPARRELHTGRYNFLHRSWGPLEPFDDSMPQILSNAGIHTHLVSDHYHYWEDGGATYHQRYTTWDCVRGQEGDAWAPLVGFSVDPQTHRNVCGSPEDNWIGQDFANRAVMPSEATQSQTVTFDKGLAFLETNHDKDNWFLQLETFDPHEPFYVQPRYKDRFPDGYRGPLLDWPDYRPVNDSDAPDVIQHVRCQYAALLSMCDCNLGRVLDAMDRYDLWKDTMLIVNTDHGFLLGEHGQWAKCHCPFYNEVARTPLFIWDPRCGRTGVRRSSLVQTIDLPATLLDYFGQRLPADMQGKSLAETITNDKPVRDAALFGLYGGQIGCTDGSWVYLRSPDHPDAPKYEYTLMPTCHTAKRRAFMSDEQLRSAELAAPFPFTKGMPLLKLRNRKDPSQAHYPTALYCLTQDPDQQTPVTDASQTARMEQLMKDLMAQNDCPREVFFRYFGI